MKIGGFLTIKDPKTRQDPYLECIENMVDLLDEVLIVDGGSTDGSLEEIPKNKKIKIIQNEWEQEFKWDFIGKQFNLGYENCDADIVARFDCDYFIHEKDFKNIRAQLENFVEPAAMIVKKQFLIADRYRFKSIIPIFFNKKRYGDRIKLNAGGDLCQPSLDGEEITEKHAIKIDVGFVWNYDFTFKHEETIKKDFGRFARAWYRYFKRYAMGGPDDESAFEFFKDMMVGRYNNSGWKIAKDHPKYIKNRIDKVSKDQFGYDMFGWIDKK